MMMSPVSAVPWADAGILVQTMERAARAFLEDLGDEERRRALHPFEGEARRDWGYTPRQRPGLPLRQMSAAQRRATWQLVDAVLSAEGAAKARGVLALEAILQQRTSDKAYRDPDNYALALFGQPGSSPWAWRFEGHHISLTLTIVPEIGVGVTPHFLGANPYSGEVVPDAHGGLGRVLARESDLAFEIVNGLGASHLAQATIAADSPADIICGPGRELTLKRTQGLPIEALPAELRRRTEALLDVFFGHLAPDLARAVMQRVREADLGRIHFAWAGAHTPEGLHYYRLHGPTLIIEYDRTERDHAHSVWHDPTNLFGDDHLRRHHLAAHRNH